MDWGWQVEEIHGPAFWAALQQKDFTQETGREKFLKYS